MESPQVGCFVITPRSMSTFFLHSFFLVSGLVIMLLNMRFYVGVWRNWSYLEKHGEHVLLLSLYGAILLVAFDHE